jgi:hypothetical protein
MRRPRLSVRSAPREMPLYPENALHHTGADDKFQAVTARLQFENSGLDRGINAAPADFGRRYP